MPFLQKISKLVRHEFAAIVRLQHLDLLLTLVLNQRLELFEFVKTLAFDLDWINPNFLWKIVSEGDKVFGRVNGSGFHRATYVKMHKVQLLGCTSCIIHKESLPLLLAFNATFTNDWRRSNTRLREVHATYHGTQCSSLHSSLVINAYSSPRSCTIVLLALSFSLFLRLKQYLAMWAHNLLKVSVDSQMHTQIHENA